MVISGYFIFLVLSILFCNNSLVNKPSPASDLCGPWVGNPSMCASNQQLVLLFLYFYLTPKELCAFLEKMMEIRLSWETYRPTPF